MKIPVVSHVAFIPKAHGLDEKEAGRPLYELEERFPFYVDGLSKYVIPSGFRFDYASVPRGLWNLFPPYDPDYAAASLIHDWLYAGEFFPRKFCDDVFLGAMIFRSVPKWKRNIMYAAVRMFGAGPYKKHTLASVMGVRRMSGFAGEKRPLWGTLWESF